MVKAMFRKFPEKNVGALGAHPPGSKARIGGSLVEAYFITFSAFLPQFIDVV